MNKLAIVTASLLAAAWSMQSFASAAQYQFTLPIYGNEVNVDGSPIASGDYLFDNSASISGTFSYDPATPATAVNQTPVNMGPTGSYSYYADSIQNLSATVAGHSISATTAGTLVADANNDSTLDSVFINAGQFNNGTPGNDGTVGSGFSGFTIGAYHLISFQLYTYGPASWFNSQALPAVLKSGDYNTTVHLVFADANNNQRLVEFDNLTGGAISTVPLPASAWLFGSAAALTLLARRRKQV